MSRGLNVKLSTAVKQVRYTNEGVEVSRISILIQLLTICERIPGQGKLIMSYFPQILAQSTKASGTEASPSLETFTGDAVLCTLPLGVLKQSDSSKSNVVSFLPALPDWKMAAVNKMGYGNQNKVCAVGAEFPKSSSSPQIKLRSYRRSATYLNRDGAQTHFSSDGFI